MIISKTPLRISFFGGGSDIPEFYKNNTGMVISTSIDSFIYLAVNRCVAPHLKVIYSQLELETDVDKIKHDRVREVLKYYDILSNIEICSFSDVPTKGTGLGSSSTFTVGLINAINYIKNNKAITADAMAEIASWIEIDKCNEPIGKQDQFAAAYGGFNVISFYSSGVDVRPLKIPYETKLSLNDRLLCFNTGQNRAASSVLTQQVENLKNHVNVNMTKTMVEMAKTSERLLLKGKIDDFGALLDDAWQVKKQLSDNVSNQHIDEMYECCIKSGALGGKILGAGGGGYLLVYVPEKAKNNVLERMKKYEKFNFHFSYEGSVLEKI